MPLTPSGTQAALPNGIPNNNFSNVGGGIAGQPVITTLYDQSPWNVLREVYQRHGEAPSFRMVLKAMGSLFSRGVAQPSLGHYEQDWDTSLVTIGSIVTPPGGAGQNMVVALDASMMYNTAVTVGGSARQASYPQVNQRILLPDGKMAYIFAKDVTTNPHRLTLRPVKAAENIDGSVTAGESYFIADNAWGEGTKLPEGVLRKVYKYSNDFQIVKAAYGTSGSVLTQEVFPIFQQDGENIAMIMNRDMLREFERNGSGALLWGQQMDNITTTDTAMGYDVSVKGTEGLITFATTLGYIDTYTPGAYTTQDLYVITRIYEQERSGIRRLVTWDGYDIYVEREQQFATLFQATLVPRMIGSFVSDSDPAAFSDGWQPNSDADFVAWMGFKGIHVGGYDIGFRQLHEFNESIGAGADAYNYTRWSIFTPLGKTKDAQNKQPRSYFGYEWRQLGNYKREAIPAQLVGAGANGYVPITQVASEYDYMKVGLVSEIAFHGACANRIVVQQPA